MPILILGMCGFVAACVFAIMFLALCSSRRASDRQQQFHQSMAIECLWLAIPCLMMIAAAIPAVITVIAPAAGH
jgi:cytochrome c oxidase subunit II